METKIKQKLVKLSRYAEKLEKISRFFAYTALIVIIPLILCDIGFKLFPQYIYFIFWVVLGIALTVGICIYTIKSVLCAVKDNTENIYKNKLVYVILSEENVVWSIITILFMIILAFDFKVWLYIIWLILILILPRKVSKHFKNKLLK